MKYNVPFTSKFIIMRLLDNLADNADCGGLHTMPQKTLSLPFARHEFHCKWQIQLHSHWHSLNKMLVHI